MTRSRCGRRTAARGMLLIAVSAMSVGVAQAQTNPSTQNNPSGTATGQVQENGQSAQPSGQQPGQQTTQQVGQQAGQRTSNQDAIGAKFEAAGQGQHGLNVQSVNPNTPAAQAGLQANDHVISADGRPFRKARHLEAYLSAQVGRPVPLVIERNGQQSTIEIMPQPTEGDHGWLGVLLEEVRPNANNAANGANQNGQRNPNVPEGQNAPQGQGQAQTQPNSNAQNATNNAQNAEPGKGAEIADMAPEGPAARAGLQRGDIITQVNGKEIDDAAELVADIHEMKPQSKAELTVVRNNQEQKVSVTLGNRAQEMAEAGQMGPGQFGPPGQFGGFPGQYPPRQFPGQNGQFVGGENGNGQQMHQQMMEQNQRIERELKELRDEVRQLREQMQKK